jgi:predicted DNA-binding transcriptional regulator AlpA
MKCLLIKLPDGRKFFTVKKAYPQLLEFAEAFKAKLEIVEANDPEILDLKDLAISICDPTKISKPTIYNVIHQKDISPENKQLFNHYTSFSKLTSRQQMMEKVTSIRSYILNRFNEGKLVKIKTLARKFEKHGISASAIYRHVNYVKTMLENTNKIIIKVKKGVYKLQ